VFTILIGLPGFAEVNVSITGMTVVGVGPPSVLLTIQTAKLWF